MRTRIGIFVTVTGLVLTLVLGVLWVNARNELTRYFPRGLRSDPATMQLADVRALIQERDRYVVFAIVSLAGTLAGVVLIILRGRKEEVVEDLPPVDTLRDFRDDGSPVSQAPTSNEQSAIEETLRIRQRHRQVERK